MQTARSNCLGLCKVSFLLVASNGWARLKQSQIVCPLLLHEKNFLSNSFILYFFLCFFYGFEDFVAFHGQIFIHHKQLSVLVDKLSHNSRKDVGYV